MSRSLDDFRTDAAAWLDANRAAAPPNYGAILPPDLVAEGVRWQKRLLDAGYAGIHWPEAHGGRGLTAEHQGVWLEECARADVPPFINMVGFVLAGQGLQRYGTDEQKAGHLGPILSADRLWCQLFSEPEAGSDLASLRTTAVRDGDGWVVNGQKVWCSGGRFSDWGILMARTSPDLPKHKGISFFVVDMHADGVEARPLRQMTGGAEFDEVFFTDLHLPATALLGPEHGGWGVGMTTLTDERGSIGAGAISMQRRLDAMARLGDGDLDDRSGAHLLTQRLVGLWSRGRTLHLLGQRQGPVASVASSLNKLGITELMFEIAELRADVGGARGMLDGAEVAGLLGAPGARIAGGTSQVQRNIIGERILGLPREPRPADG